jgi:hypothetical protein
MKDDELRSMIKMAVALRRIQMIKNKEYGGDYDEIEEAREIAAKALRETGFDRYYKFEKEKS